MTTLLLLPPAVIATATISGILGMGGGMLLMAALAVLLPVGSAMVLHGITQFASNGSRAYMLRQHIQVRAVGWYALGAALAVAIFTSLALRVDRATLLLWLGLSPILIFLVPARLVPRFETRGGATTAGFATTTLQLIAGAAGPLFDLFFARSTMNRFEIVGTKALSQCLGHAIKTIYFGALIASDSFLPIWVYAVAIVCAVIGSHIGRHILGRLGEARFRRYTTYALILIGLVCSTGGLIEMIG